MKRTLSRLGLLALVTSALVGCSGGGSDGLPGTAGTPGTPGASGSNGTTDISLNGSTPSDTVLATWKALKPEITVTGVSIASPPVVTFVVKDAEGSGVTGLGSKSKSSTTTIAGLTNMAFTLAKLVPGKNGSPSTWVSYNVLKPPTVAQKAGTLAATDSCTADKSWCGTYPTSDTQGTLVETKNGVAVADGQGDGGYKYTFHRDPKLVAGIVASLVDSVDGLSKKADLGDVSFDPTLTHRLGIQIGGNAPGTGTNTPTGATSALASVAMGLPANAVYDFRPDGGAIATTRDIVKIDSCSGCHQGKVLAHGSRKDPRYCVTCHTDQVKYSMSGEASVAADGLTLNGKTRNTTAVLDGRAIGHLPNFIHKIHMGEELVRHGYNYIPNATTGVGFNLNEIKYPQDQRNCTKCHDGSATAANKTADGDNWKKNPSRLACGSCHDGINFATGLGTTNSGATTGHLAAGLIQRDNDDSKCIDCHGAADNERYHVSVTPPDTSSALHVNGGSANTNAAAAASNANHLPEGAIKVTYDVKSVSRNASKQPVMEFRLLQNGAAVPFKDPATSTEIWDNFMGAPSIYFVFAVPQDGIAKPADFNASASSYLRSLWNGKATGASAGTLTYNAASGYYTAILTGVVVPDSAVMLTGGIGYSYNVSSTMPLTQTNLAEFPVSPATATTLTAGMPNKIGGLLVGAPNVQKVATGYTGRRAIVDNAKCGSCHQTLGLFPKAQFHAGQRNDGSTCSWCHTPNRTSSAWSADSTNYIHAIHGGLGTTGNSSGGKNKRTVKFTWHAASTTAGFWDIGYPGALKNCEGCHLPNTVNFGATASSVPNRQYRTVATGYFNGTVGAVTKSFSGATCAAGTGKQTEVGAFALSPYVSKDNSTLYGQGFTFNAGLTTTTLCTLTAAGASVTIPSGGTREADPTTLVLSPITAACFGCHDSASAVNHMELNGGSIYKPRATALATMEDCQTCHGAGRDIDTAKEHKK